ncbi:MAG: hypothetical protein MI923_16885, partial [Phycisphaerales bacterium]|nr:hypothetical protein [Phycisphaerales bacterium]
ELSFEWSHHRISSTNAKVTVTFQNSLKHSGSERGKQPTIISETRHLQHNKQYLQQPKFPFKVE